MMLFSKRLLMQHISTYADELDKVGLNPLWEILEKYGGWPMLYEEGTWNSSNFDWMKSMADLKKFFGTSTLLDINSNQNTNSIKYNTIHVSSTIPRNLLFHIITFFSAIYPKQFLNCEFIFVQMSGAATVYVPSTALFVGSRNILKCDSCV